MRFPFRFRYCAISTPFDSFRDPGPSLVCSLCHLPRRAPPPRRPPGGPPAPGRPRGSRTRSPGRARELLWRSRGGIARRRRRRRRARRRGRRRTRNPSAPHRRTPPRSWRVRARARRDPVCFRSGRFRREVSEPRREEKKSDTASRGTRRRFFVFFTFLGPGDAPIAWLPRRGVSWISPHALPRRPLAGPPWPWR